MFYDRYVSLCKRKGVAPSTAAMEAGFHKGTVSIWKKKRNAGEDVSPDQPIIDKICAYFNVSEAYLRGFDQEGIKKEPFPSEGLSEKQLEAIELIMNMSDEELENKLDPITAILKL